jgi:hypothetical protein
VRYAPRVLKRFSCFLSALATLLVALLFAVPARADKVVVLPFTSPNNVPRPELEEARKWTLEAVAKSGHTFASDDEMVSVRHAIKDGTADNSEEYVAAGKVAGAAWTLTGRVERVDHPPETEPGGTEQPGYTSYRIELEACQVASGRVESLSREVLPEDAAADLQPMIALLLRPEGIANAVIPWERTGVHPKPRPQTPPPPPEPPPPTHGVRMEEERPVMREVYGRGHPVMIAASIGVTNAITRPAQARGSSWALPIGGAVGYALPDAVKGLELRAEMTGQVAGPAALAIEGGARWAVAPIPEYRLFVGPEVLLGAHIAEGADKTARFLLHGALFLAYGITENLQVEIAGDLMPAFGGSGTLLLGGGTARVAVRF